VVLNWHLENAGYLWEACDLASREAPDARFLLLENPFPDFTDAELATIFPEGFSGWAVEHASLVETSLMLAVAPEQVRLDRVADDRAERHPNWDVIPAPAEFVPRSGVLATPSLASEETGKLLLDATVGRLVEAMRTELVLDPGWVRPRS
jgi:creatinine amidohydrolase